jgi:hypothetical protein
VFIRGRFLIYISCRGALQVQRQQALQDLLIAQGMRPPGAHRDYSANPRDLHHQPGSGIIEIESEAGDMKLFTIGHSNHNLEKFTRLLAENETAILVDVRTAPYSRYNPQFNKENLQSSLGLHDIQYVYAGKFLGGRPSDPSCYKSHVLPVESVDHLHEVDYQEVMKRKWFMEGIQQLLELADQDTTAIMCSEEDPAKCHRHHLIARYLVAEHPEIDIRHIRGDGMVFRASVSTTVDQPQAEQLSFF